MLQTAALVVLSLPAIIGKVTLLLNAAAIQRILLAPIRFVRFLTDPIVDVIVEILTDVVLGPSKLSGQGLLNIISKRFPSTSTVLLDPIPGRARLAAASIVKRLSAALPSTAASKSDTAAKSALASRAYDLGEGLFAVLGRASINLWVRVRGFADGIAGSVETRDRALVILWGYIQIVTCVVSFGIFGEDVLGSVASPIVAALKQQAIILKVCDVKSQADVAASLLHGYRAGRLPLRSRYRPANLSIAIVPECDTRKSIPRLYRFAVPKCIRGLAIWHAVRRTSTAFPLLIR